MCKSASPSRSREYIFAIHCFQLFFVLLISFFFFNCIHLAGEAKKSVCEIPGE